MLLFIIHFQTQLTKTADVKPLEQDLNFVCQYSPKHGIKVRTICYTYLVFSTHEHVCTIWQLVFKYSKLIVCKLCIGFSNIMVVGVVNNCHCVQKRFIWNKSNSLTNCNGLSDIFEPSMFKCIFLPPYWRPVSFHQFQNLVCHALCSYNLCNIFEGLYCLHHCHLFTF